MTILSASEERGAMRLIAVVAALAAMVLLPHDATAADRGTLVARSSRYGPVLFDGKGFVLYAFTKDRGRSACSGACAAAWPPYLAKHPRAGTGAKASLLGTTRRADGSVQVTYAGRLL